MAGWIVPTALELGLGCAMSERDWAEFINRVGINKASNRTWQVSQHIGQIMQPTLVLVDKSQPPTYSKAEQDDDENNIHKS